MSVSAVWCLSLLIVSSAVTHTTRAVTVLPKTCMSHHQPGDIVLGGIFPLRFASRPACSGRLSPWAVRLAEGMVFTINEINRRDDLLPNVTLGYDLRDDCRSEEVAMWTTLSFIHNSSTAFPEYLDCTPETVGRVSGIVGTGFSQTSIFVAKTASLFQVPVVSYAASSDELSDNTAFPYFLRTYPPDSLQVDVILDVLVHFQWEYIALLYSLTSDGIHGAFALQEQAEEMGVCVAFLSPMREFPTDDELEAIIEKLQTHSKVEVVVLFGAKSEAQAVLRAVKESGMRQIVWLGTTHWGYQLLEDDLGDVAVGALFVRDYRPTVQAFGEYYASLDPSSPDTSPWFKEMANEWLLTKNCSHLSKCPLSRGNTEGLIMNSVNAFAYAMDTLLRQNCSEGLCQQDNLQQMSGESLLHALRNVQFKGPYGQVSFDSNGDGRGRYGVSNWQYHNGKYKMEDIGVWDAVNSTHLWLNDHLIQWPGNSSSQPRSVCREDCLPGYAFTTLRQRCCSGCTKCLDNNIVVNETLCSPCEEAHWPDSDFKTCIPIVPTRLQLSDPLVATVLSLLIVGLACCLLTGFGMVAKRKHILIKATSRELTCIHITGLMLSYGAGLILLTAYPTLASCIAFESFISISFTMSYAPTLLKVLRIHRIFKSGRVTNKRPRFTSPKSQIVIVVIFIVAQLIMSFLSATLSPSTPYKLYTLDMGNYSEIYCAFGYGFLAPCLLNLAIITACCYFAFRARKVPDNYNESRFIGISVYTTLVLCLAAIPVYTTTNRVLPKVATISLAVTLNSYLSLVCLYLSKLYVIVCGYKVQPSTNRGSFTLQNAASTSAFAATTSNVRQPVMSAWGSESTHGLNPMMAYGASTSESNKA
ncbi:metabotropic glutamate receptor 4-like [Patiria miniata]|uniref:G-protein coupled receptors family 3 profile domain-containing protein n=1 Tax=Patiria miniata TaxID=46514 RepID=A0A914BDP5_PATMI|nr:metabotropic glutamate receptor 4-like [Patiria miniata]